MKEFIAFAPATIANFNVGYDVLGLSLNEMGDEVKLIINGSKQNKIIEIINGKGLPFNVDKNCCSVVIQKMQEAQKKFIGVDIIIKKGFAAGSGLGSSSASSAAAAFAYNKLIGSIYTTKELVFFAAEGERIACGTPHIDNVAPALLGGLILTKGNTPKDIIELPLIDDLYAVTLFPSIEIKTSDAREILSDTSINLPTLSKQVSLMGSFITSLYEKDLELFSTSLIDMVVEPKRSKLIPKFRELKITAFQSKALAFGISGSGPSVFAIAKNNKQASKIEKSLENVFLNTSIKIKTSKHLIHKESGARMIHP